MILATKRGKRELIAQAQLRRGIALFGLERWGDAERVFGWVRKLDEKMRSLGIWEAKAQGKMNGLEAGDQKGIASVKEVPEEVVPEEKLASKDEGENGVKKLEAEKTGEEEKKKEAAGVQTPASKIRHEWYQTSENVVVTLLAKGVPKPGTAVDLHRQALSISFPLPGGSDFDFSLDPLFAPIDIVASRFKIMSTKVEFVLKKATPGQKWPSLEGNAIDADGDTKSSTDQGATTKSTIPTPSNASSTPSYPTSSKSGPKNWDKLAADLTKKPAPQPILSSSTNDAATTTPPPSSDLLIDEDDEDDAPENAFFKKLYAGADPDTRRAMMKSYQESNGTALSTNWEEVSKGKVETSPPDGMVARKWGE